MILVFSEERWIRNDKTCISLKSYLKTQDDFTLQIFCNPLLCFHFSSQLSQIYHWPHHWLTRSAQCWGLEESSLESLTRRLSLSLYIYYAGRVGFSFIKWSRRVKSLSNHLDTRDPPLEIDETKLYALEVQESFCLVFSPLFIRNNGCSHSSDKYHHVPLSNRPIWDTNYHTFYFLPPPDRIDLKIFATKMVT